MRRRAKPPLPQRLGLDPVRMRMPAEGPWRTLREHLVFRPDWENVVGPVLDYDERRGTELVATLRAYFANGSQLARTKDVLHVHVNTVVQRLERVASLLGEDWQAPDRALEIQLALRLHRLGAPR